MRKRRCGGRAAWFLLPLCVAFCRLAFADDEAGNPPAGSDCCVPHAGGGCDDPLCSTTVCDFDVKCCFTWDNTCVGWAEDLCGTLCGGGGGCPGTEACCSAHATPACDDPLCCDQVCSRNAACCSSAWSSACAGLAIDICDVCEPPIECPMEGECCAFNFTPGCDRKACCELVCIELGDEYCCRGKWDDLCAAKARNNCPNICVCNLFGDLNDDRAIDLKDIAAFQNCFASGGTAVGDECACADHDADDDADLLDFTSLAPHFRQP